MTPHVSFHGSDIEAASAYYHIPQEQITCFSANVNPLGLSKALKEKLKKKLKKESSKGKFKKKVQERGKLWLKTECGEKLCWLETCFFWLL